MAKGSALKGALAASPRGGRVTSLPVGAPPQGAAQGAAQSAAQRAGLQRLSPGVYRNPQGQLVGSRGQSLPNQQPQRPSMQPQPQQPAFRQPAPYQPQDGQNVMWMGGSPNFDESTGQYRNGAVAGAGSAFNTKPFMFPQQQGMQPNMMYPARMPNFNQMDGQYDPFSLAKMQAGQAAQPQFGQGIMANQQPLAPNGQMSPAELQAMQNGGFKGYKS